MSCPALPQNKGITEKEKHIRDYFKYYLQLYLESNLPNGEVKKSSTNVKSSGQRFDKKLNVYIVLPYSYIPAHYLLMYKGKAVFLELRR